MGQENRSARGGMFGACVVFILILALVHRRPAEMVAVDISNGAKPGKWPSRLNLLTWNIGYGAMGEEADFFMDGGRTVMPPNRATVLGHLTNIASVLRGNAEDVYLLQEVDRESHRSYELDEAALVASGLTGYSRSFAANHDVWFVPYPFTQPMGRVRSGLLSLGAYRPAEATRIQLPGSFPWPISSFALDRCALVWKLPRQDGKQWVVINIHLTAWDNKGEMRTQQLEYLRRYAVGEYQSGGYVIIGGDWNSVLPGVRLDQFPSTEKPSEYVKVLPQDAFPEGWHWGVAADYPTNRQASAPYVAGRTFVTTIDGFLTSPNVQVESVKAIPEQFRDSDHEPVTVSVVGN